MRPQIMALSGGPAGPGTRGSGEREAGPALRVTAGACAWHREGVTSTGAGSVGPRPDGVETTLTGFARAVRAAGVPVTTDRTQAFLRAVSVVGVTGRTGVY